MADILINVDVLGINKIKDLSIGLRNLIGSVNGASAATKALDARQRALNIALGNGTGTNKQHAKTISEMARNQAVLSREIKQVTQDLRTLEAAKRTGLITGQQFKKTSADLTQYGQTLKNVKIRAFGSDLQNVGLELRRMGKDAQFTGRNLIIGLTTPIMMFARTALYSLLSVDRETVRLTKLLEGTAMSVEQAYIKLDTSQAQVEQQLRSTSATQVAAAEEIQRKVNAMTQSYQKLNDEITRQSLKFGVAKELVTAITGDFAELGFAANESVTRLAELTLQMEKLGGLDVTSSQQFVQSVYQQTARIVDASGRQFESTAEREKVIIDSVTAQLAMFNTVENVTAASLRDLAEAFPEMAAAATSFGLSMTEATALLAPMKAAGFEIGASANSIKVSLQRLVAPTKQNMDLINNLADSYAQKLGVDSIKHFKEVSGAGIDSLQSLIDMFIALDDQGRNTEATLEFFAEVFGVRQGPRMERSIAELALFQKRLQGVSGTASNMEIQVREVFNTALKESQKANGGAIQLINTVEDIGIAARIATAQVGQTVEGFGKVTQQDINNAKNARKALADFIKERAMEGEDVFAGITTQAGKALVVQMAGASSAMDIADKELKQSLGSLAVQFDRLKVAFKITASDLINQFRPAIEKIIDSVIKFMEKIRQMDPALKKILAGVLAFVASIGPLVFVFGQAKLAGGVILQTIGRLLPGIGNLSAEAVAAAPALMRLNKPLVMVGNTITSDAGKFSILTAKLASMETPLGRLVKKFGEFTGVLKKTRTAQDAVLDSVNALSGAGRGAGTGVTATPGFLGGTPKFDRAVENKLKTNFRKQFGITTSQYKKIMQTAVVDASGDYAFPTVQRAPGGKFQKIPASVKRLQKKALAVTPNVKSSIDDVLDNMRNQAILDVADDFNQKVAQSANQPVKQPPKTLKEFGSSLKKGIGDKASSVKQFATKTVDRATDLGKGAINIGKKVADQFVNAGNKVKTFAGMVRTGPVGALKYLGAGSLDFSKNFIKGIMNSTKAFQIFKFTMISSGIGLVLLAVAAVVMIVMKNFDKFKKAVEPAINTFKTTFEILKGAIMSLIQPFLDFIAGFIGGSDKAGGAVNGIASVVTFLANTVRIVAEIIAWVMRNVVAKAITFLLKPVAAVIRGIINFFMGIKKAVTGDVLGGLKQAFSGMAQAAIGMMGPFAHVFRFIISGLLQITKAAGSVLGWIPGVGKYLSAPARAASAALEGILGFIDDAMSMGDGKKLVEGATSGADSAAKDVGETIGDSIGEGIDESLTSGGGASSAQGALKDMMQEFVDKTLDYVSENIKDYTGQLVDALNEQKAAALKVFDDQLKTIETLEKAEESLTKTKEYELNRRTMLDERELNRQNYVRNRALAIYEGRIDDARMLDLEEQKAKIESAKDIEQLDQRRADDLAKENRDAIRDAIKEAKDQASEYYDSVIENFQKAAEKITEFPPNTIDEFNAQLNQLTNAAIKVAGEANTEFSNMMQGLAEKVTTGLPNEAVGAFSTSLDQLVTEAVNKYGLGTQTGDNKTVIGSTIGMLNQIPNRINTGEWSEKSKNLFGKNLNGLSIEMGKFGKKLLGDKGDPKSLRGVLSNIRGVLKNNNPFLVWVDAMKRANISIRKGLERTIDSVISKTKTLAAGLSAELQMIANAMNAAANAGGGGGGGSEKSAGGAPSQLKGEAPAGNYWIDEFNDSGSFAFQSRKNLPRTLSPNPAPAASNKLATAPMFAYGGKVRSMAVGGFTPGFESMSVPTILHGGEFVVSAKAVRNIGLATLQNLNAMKNANLSTPSGQGGSSSYSEQNISICVDNFIGEKQWFESMMKEYNIKVVPNNQRAAGKNNRVVRTYNGINRGM